MVAEGEYKVKPPPKPHGIVSCDDVSAIVKEISSHSAPDDGSGRGGDEIERRGSSFGSSFSRMTTSWVRRYLSPRGGICGELRHVRSSRSTASNF